MKRPSQRPAPVTRRTTADGDVIGVRADNGAHVWLGVPYGVSTAGSNRWRAQQPPLSWQGSRETVAAAECCAQLTNEFDADEGLKPGLVVGTEICLTLDIYAPNDALGRSLPVMVWIHGGGNLWWAIRRLRRFTADRQRGRHYRCRPISCRIDWVVRTQGAT